MSEASDFLEHMEHAGHGGHGHDEHGGGAPHAGPGKQIGITMAMLGVMLALCAALVGSHRTELIKTTIEQANEWGVYQSETMKFRIIEGDVEMLKALTPKESEREELKADLLQHAKPNGAKDDEDTLEIKTLIAESTDDMARLLTPDEKEIHEFEKLARRYEADVTDAKEDAESYDPAIEAHEGAAEWYERAQLLAEIGIVIASIALLMSSKKIWAVAVVLGICGGSIIGWTFVKTRGQLATAEKKIADEQAEGAKIEKDDEEPVAEGPSSTEKKDEAPKATSPTSKGSGSK